MSSPTTDSTSKVDAKAAPAKPGIGAAIARIFKKDEAEDPLEQKVIARRRRKAERMRASLTVLPASHASPVSRAQDVAQAIMDAARMRAGAH